VKTRMAPLLLCASAFAQTIDVTVVNAATHAPVAGAQVSSGCFADGQRILFTGSAGRVALKPGVFCSVQVSRAGFLDASTSILTKPGKTPPSGVEVALTPQAVISGKIVDADGFPARDAQVQVLRYRMVQGKRELRPVTGAVSKSNDAGEYRVAKLPEGSYFVRVSSAALHKWDSRYGAEYFGGTTLPLNRNKVAVKTGQIRSGIDFRLTPHPELTVTGRVARPEGVPRPKSVTVDLSSPFAEPLSVRADERGEFVIRHVQPNSSMLAAIRPPLRPGNVTAEQTIEVGDSNLDQVVIAARVVTPVDVKGTLTADAGSTERLSVRLRAVSGAGTVRAEVGKDGSFTLKGVLPQQYSLSLEAVPQSAAPSLPPPRLISACLGARDVSLGAFDFSAAPEPLNLSATWNFETVEGKLIDRSGRGVSGRYVQLLPAGQNSSPLFSWTVTNWDGSFKLSVLPGDHFLYIADGLESLADPDYLDAHRSDFRPVHVVRGANPGLIVKPASSFGRAWRMLRRPTRAQPAPARCAAISKSG
jgi:hypothetical protein